MDLQPILPYLPLAGAAAAGLVLGVLITAILAGRKTAAARERAAVAEATLEAESRAHAARVQGLEALHAEIEARLSSVADAALRQNSQNFLHSARELFETQKAALLSESDGKRAAMDALLRPVSDTLKRYEERLGEVEKARAEAYGGLTGQITQLALAQDAVRSEAQKLSSALRAAPKTRGRWGEQQLRNVMELAGMADRVDFRTESSFERDEDRLRPDAVIRLPGGRQIVVDAKASMSAYLDSIEAADEAARELLLRKHAQELRTQAKLLSGKAYWDRQAPGTDFVAMFVPGDNFFAAAMERDPELFADAIKGKVIIVTPTTLVALAKSVALGWRQQAVEQNAAAVADLGKELYRRLITLGDTIAKLGGSLETSVKNYNAFIASLEGSVLPQARKFRDLQVETGGKEIAETKPVDLALREPRADRDLTLGRPANSAF